MSESPESIVIESDEIISAALKEFSNEHGATIAVRELKGHAGDPTTWISVLQAASPIVAVLIPFLIEKLKTGKITKAIINGHEIEGQLTADDITKLHDALTPQDE